MSGDAWRFWIDRGGTFTDVVGQMPDGRLQIHKLLSEDPLHYPDAAAEGIHRLLKSSPPPWCVAEIRMGTTVATNALLERKGAKTGFLTTRGFKDALSIGEQNRPAIFELEIRKPAMLYAAVNEADERLDADGTVLTPLDRSATAVIFDEWRRAGIDSVAICFMHAWRNPVHEIAAAELARTAGFSQISVSHEVSPLMKLVSRGNTTLADAYLSPVLAHYLDQFRLQLDRLNINCARILFMQSNGGLVAGEFFRGKDSILSGPAGGVAGMGAAAGIAGDEQLIGFDMGGTSTDVSVYSGEPEISNDNFIAGMHMRTPMIKIHTIAAGGGSVLKYLDGRLQTGPESAGANPGPLCYGRKGPLTVTDANVMLGRIQPAWFPQVFGPNANQSLDNTQVSNAFTELSQILADDGLAFTPEDVAAGFLSVAVDSMANAIRQISIRRGLDPQAFTLCCFGGAAGQHACQVADQLGMSRILLDPLAPVLSAWGMGAAPLRSYRQQAVNKALNAASLQSLTPLCEELAEECRESLTAQGATNIRLRQWFYIRQAGSNTSLPVTASSEQALRAEFLQAHQARFGFTEKHASLEIESIRIEAQSEINFSTHVPIATEPHETAQPGRTKIYTAGNWETAPVYKRDQLTPGDEIPGPAVIVEEHTTIVVEPGWVLTVNDALQLLLRRSSPVGDAQTSNQTVDPVKLEIFNNHFMHIAGEMGAVLQKTARSVNIKERMDFSCALFTPTGELIANAPHVPVHLGSMDDSVKSLLREHPEDLGSGTSFIANAPYNGGTHLPDITVISPVLNKANQLLFIVASRAHHADIGGTTPGSMPPFSQHIDEEGIVFNNVAVVANGRFLQAEIRQRLSAGQYPARNPEQNIIDIRAQIAANERGRLLLLEMLNKQGKAVVSAYTQHVLDNAEESVRRVIERLGEGSFTCHLDNGQKICVKVSINPELREACIDFSGTSAMAQNNLNAPAAISQAAVLYVFRTLVKHNIPLNAGCKRPLKIVIPPGCMLNPVYPAAVVGGNVETSQCVTNALYGALGIMAAAQGTMNNLSFGNNDLQYYETICGGAGAGPDFKGADAVQTHMTNSRMTDAEVLETRYPVIVREFSVRQGSGGQGAQPGGNGAVRKLEFRTTLSAAILSDHRQIPPFGLAGGKAAQTGKNSIVRHDGTTEEFAGTMMTQLNAGDVLVIETPGGGGYGTPPEPA